MQFRRIAEEITEGEINQVLELMFESSARLISYDKRIEHNYIEVYYFLPSDDTIHRMDLLPDSIYDMDKDKEFVNGEINWKYMQFTVAKGYSELWVNNIWKNDTV